MKRKRTVALCVGAAIGCLTIFVAVYVSIERPTPVDALRIAVAKVSIGSTVDEADAAMGMMPVSITEIDGYLMAPMVMLTPENELTPEDKVERYSLRKYADDGHYAVVAVRPDGQVAGKWAGPNP